MGNDEKELVATLRDLEQRGSWMGSMPAEDVGRIAGKAASTIERLSAISATKQDDENAPYKQLPPAEQIDFLEECLRVTRGWCSVWKREASAREQERDALREAVRKASQMADIAIDWNLEEVEIDGEMIGVHNLRDEFDAALNQNRTDASEAK